MLGYDVHYGLYRSPSFLLSVMAPLLLWLLLKVVGVSVATKNAR